MVQSPEIVVKTVSEKQKLCFQSVPYFNSKEKSYETSKIDTQFAYI